MSNDYDNIWYDDDGNSWLSDENGKPLKDEKGRFIPPTKSQRKTDSNGFTYYDSSRGHCSLCGDLYCRGECFK